MLSLDQIRDRANALADKVDSLYRFFYALAPDRGLTESLRVRSGDTLAAAAWIINDARYAVSGLPFPVFSAWCKPTPKRWGRRSQSTPDWFSLVVDEYTFGPPSPHPLPSYPATRTNIYEAAGLPEWTMPEGHKVITYTRKFPAEFSAGFAGTFARPVEYIHQPDDGNWDPSEGRPGYHNTHREEGTLTPYSTFRVGDVARCRANSACYTRVADGWEIHDNRYAAVVTTLTEPDFGVIGGVANYSGSGDYIGDWLFDEVEAVIALCRYSWTGGGTGRALSSPYLRLAAPRDRLRIHHRPTITPAARIPAPPAVSAAGGRRPFRATGTDTTLQQRKSARNMTKMTSNASKEQSTTGRLRRP